MIDRVGRSITATSIVGHRSRMRRFPSSISSSFSPFMSEESERDEIGELDFRVVGRMVHDKKDASRTIHVRWGERKSEERKTTRGAKQITILLGARRTSQLTANLNKYHVMPYSPLVPMHVARIERQSRSKRLRERGKIEGNKKEGSRVRVSERERERAKYYFPSLRAIVDGGIVYVCVGGWSGDGRRTKRRSYLSKKACKRRRPIHG